MRTTLEIADELFRLAKKKAADQGVPLRGVVEAALRSYLEPRRQHAKYKLDWHTETGRQLPGVDLDDRKSLLDMMDGRR